MQKAFPSAVLLASLLLSLVVPSLHAERTGTNPHPQAQSGVTLAEVFAWLRRFEPVRLLPFGAGAPRRSASQKLSETAEAMRGEGMPWYSLSSNLAVRTAAIKAAITRRTLTGILAGVGMAGA